jgi:hypothetical protein
MSTLIRYLCTSIQSKGYDLNIPQRSYTMTKYIRLDLHPVVYLICYKEEYKIIPSIVIPYSILTWIRCEVSTQKVQLHYKY